MANQGYSSKQMAELIPTLSVTMPPTKTPGSRIARLDDTCGNLIQLTRMDWG